MGRRLDAARARYEADPTLFSRLILDRLVNNPHRLRSVLSPDAGRQARDDAAFTARMLTERARRTDAETLALAEKAAAVEAAVGEPNSPEQVALLPQLKVSDLPAKPRHIPTRTEWIPTGAGAAASVPVLRNDCFSNGVNYLQFSLNLAGLPDDLWPVLPYYCDTITKLGAAGMNFETMAQRVASATGGISCAPAFQYHAVKPDLPVLTLRFACKALDNQVGEAMGVLRDLVFAADPRDRARMKDVLVQARAGCRSDILENGHSYSQCHAARRLTEIGWLDEHCHGIPQVALVGRLCDRFEDEIETLMSQIERIRAFILSPDRLTVSVTGSDRAYATIHSEIVNWIGAMTGTPLGSPVTSPPRARAPYPPEGLAVPIQVAHCAQGLRAPRLQDPRAAALSIGSHLLRFEYFLTELRLKGNAYGGGISYNPVSGTLFMTSFRDPHVARTLDVFARTPDFVRSAPWSQADVDRAIIGTAKGDEKPLRPGEVTGDALARHLQGVTPELREAFHAARLAVTPTAARTALLETLETGLDSSAICVLSSREKLEDANQTLGPRALAIEDVQM